MISPEIISITAFAFATVLVAYSSFRHRKKLRILANINLLAVFGISSLSYYTQNYLVVVVLWYLLALSILFLYLSSKYE